jgi:ABC-type glycerol-3-phosphate transport system substrate-binding protein
MRAKLSLSLALTAAACGGSDDSSSSPSAGAKDLEGQTITYWASNQAPSIHADYRTLEREAAKFTAQEGQMEQFLGAAIKGLVATAASKGTVFAAQVKAALSDPNEKMAAAG